MACIATIFNPPLPNFPDFQGENTVAKIQITRNRNIELGKNITYSIYIS